MHGQQANMGKPRAKQIQVVSRIDTRLVDRGFIIILKRKKARKSERHRHEHTGA